MKTNTEGLTATAFPFSQSNKLLLVLLLDHTQPN